MRLLAIDTATDVCSAALLSEDQLWLEELIQPQGHSELILGMIDTLLHRAEVERSQLDALAFGRGPGSFTGLRIGAGVAQGVAFGCECPVVPVSNLAALALNASRSFGAQRVLAAFDARMGEVYWGGFDVSESAAGRPQVKEVIAEAVASAESVRFPSAGDAAWTGVGDGWASHGEILRERGAGRMTAIHPQLRPSAREIALIGRHLFESGGGLPPEAAQPVYLRNQVARKPSVTPLR